MAASALDFVSYPISHSLLITIGRYGRGAWVLAIAVSALALWLFIPWGWWIDRHRETVNAV